MNTLRYSSRNTSALRVTFTCPNPSCGSLIEEDVENATFNWSNDGTDDGIDQRMTATICTSCGKEYIVEVIDKGSEKEVLLPEHRDVKVHFEDSTGTDALFDEYEEYLSQFEAQDPDEVFEITLDELKELEVGSTIHHSVRHAFLQMLYLRYVSALEAYLSDRMINIISEDPDTLVKLIGATEQLRQVQPKLIDVAKEPGIALRLTKAHLQRFSFHDLGNVAKMYKAVLGVDLFASKDNETRLLDMVLTRHDLAHRNGRNTEGKQIVISEEDLLRAKFLVRGVYDRVEEAYRYHFRPMDDFVLF